MAAIDKTYVNSWSQIQETIDWASTVGNVTDDYDNPLNPMWWLSDWTENYFNTWAEEFKKKGQEVCIPMWNTPTYFDVWLIRNCPIDFIQERLQYVYGQDEYESIKNHTSIYDTYVRNVGVHYSVSSTRYKCPFKDDKMTWWIDINDMFYDKKKDTWRDMYREPGPWTSSHYVFNGILSHRKLSRLLKKWRLPVGAKVHISGDYHRHIMRDFTVTIKK